MSKQSDMAKLELIAKYISDAEMIIARHKSVEATLADYEGEYAVTMCLVQIAETVNRISDESILEAIEARSIIGFRNRIVHNYEGRDQAIVSGILKKDIPELKEKILGLIPRG